MLLSLVANEGQAQIHLINDLFEPVEGMLRVVAETFDGQRLGGAQYYVTAPANAAAEVASFDLAPIVGHEREALVFAEFESEYLPTAQNYLFFAEPKDWRLANPELRIIIEQTRDEIELSIIAKRFAPYVWLRLSDDEPLFDGGFDNCENFFHIRAGECGSYISFTAREGLATVDEVRNRLVVRSF
jgi:hypothetical protein